MKKIISVKEILIVLIAVILITIANSAFALDLNENLADPGTITPGEYENAQIAPDDENNITGNNTIGNNSTENNTTGNNAIGNNTVKKYNTNSSNLPQTGIEDYNVGILLVICIASAIFAYKKVNDYKNI